MPLPSYKKAMERYPKPNLVFLGTYNGRLDVVYLPAKEQFLSMVINHGTYYLEQKNNFIFSL